MSHLQSETRVVGKPVETARLIQIDKDARVHILLSRWHCIDSSCYWTGSERKQALSVLKDSMKDSMKDESFIESFIESFRGLKASDLCPPTGAGLWRIQCDATTRDLNQ